MFAKKKKAKKKKKDGKKEKPLNERCNYINTLRRHYFLYCLT